MEERTISAVDVGTTKMNTSIANLKLIMAQHIISQDSGYRDADVQHILTETKVGAWKKADLLKKLRIVFSTS